MFSICFPILSIYFPILCIYFLYLSIYVLLIYFPILSTYFPILSIYFSHPFNLFLHHLHQTANPSIYNCIRNRLEVVKSEFPWLSYGDLWTLAAFVAIKEMGGPTIPWQAGRVDSTAVNPQVPPNGRLPNAHLVAAHIRAVFVERMGFSQLETVALILGGHGIGRSLPPRYLRFSRPMDNGTSHILERIRPHLGNHGKAIEIC